MRVRKYLSVTTKELPEESQRFVARMPHTDALAVCETDFPGHYLVKLNLNAKDTESLRVLSEAPASFRKILEYAAEEGCLMLFVEDGVEADK